MQLVELPETTDGQLIVRIAGGDRRAFDELHGRYARAVLGLALRRLGDRGRAEDATQEAFVAIWRSARTYDPSRGRGAPWLYAVARNAITDGCAARPSRSPSSRTAPGAIPTRPTRPRASWTAWRVHRALEVLPEHERPVIELAYWRGLSQSEIADRLDDPARHGEDAHAKRARAARRRARRGARDEARLRRARRHRPRAGRARAARARPRAARRCRPAARAGSRLRSSCTRRGGAVRSSPSPRRSPSRPSRSAPRSSDGSGGRSLDFTETMAGTAAAAEATASLAVFDIDEAGNWPMELTVAGLRGA